MWNSKSKRGRAGQAAHRRGVVALALALVVGGSYAAGAGAKTPFVTAKVPLNQTVKSLLAGKFSQTVTCRHSCEVIARLFIRAQVARQLGFKNVQSGQPYAIALKQVTLKSEQPTSVRIAVGRNAKKRLAKWKQRLQITGETYASSTSSDDRGQANWITTLRR